MTSGRARAFAAGGGLSALVAVDLFLRHTLEHADQFLYSFLPYFYPDAEKFLFHGTYPTWRLLLLPMQPVGGAWSASLVITHLLEMRIGVAATWYLFNVLLLVGSFAIAQIAFRSLAFSFTFAIGMAFGTHFYHTYTVPGGMASPLIALVFECLLLCCYRVIAAERGRAFWWAAFAVAALASALSYEGWLDLVAALCIAAPIVAIALYRPHPAAARRTLGVMAAIVALAGLYVILKTRLGYGQIEGSESDVVFNYHLWAPMLEDVASNTITHLYMAATNFLPPVFLSSTSLFVYGADKLVELQRSYHGAYSYLVPMHYIFLWRYAAGAVALATAFVFVKLVWRTWREPSADRLAMVVFMTLMIMAGATHAIVKIRPMKTMPVMDYHVLVGVMGVTMMIAYGVMVAWREWRATAPRVAVTAAVWGLIFYGALTRPIMLNHMASEVGLPGLYPNPMNSLRVMLGLPEDTTGDLNGYRLMKYVPRAQPQAQEAAAPAGGATKPPADAPAASAAPPAPAAVAAAPAVPAAPRPLGESAPSLPGGMPALSQWDAIAGVKVTTVAGEYVVEGNATGGYQLMSPLFSVPASKQLLIKATGTMERGSICFGAIDASQQKWLHPAASPESEFLLSTGENKSIRLVFAACQGATEPPRFRVKSITYAVLDGR